MSAAVATARSPALWVVAPFFLAAPLGLVVAGLLLMGADHDSLVAVNLPRNVAITHALVIGWLTTTIMGATYQLAPVVIGGQLWSERLAHFQLVLHVGSIGAFIWALLDWNLAAMAFAGASLFFSFVIYVLNVGAAVRSGPAWTLTRGYLAVALGFLVAAFSLGLTWVGALQPSHQWFPITLGRLSAHAHLGLVGWLAITVMGVSYQLVPMFNVITRPRPRFGWLALALTAAGTALFASVIAFSPAVAVRVALALFLAFGPLLWAADQLLLMRHRSRRRLDVQGRAVFVGPMFLALAALLGLGAAAGTPLTPDSEPARWLLAYAAAAVVGWAGTTLIGNSYKVMPFLIWYHRYRTRVGQAPVPMVADLYSERVAHAVLVAIGVATLVLVGASLLGSVDGLRAGGAILSLAGAAHLLSMLQMFIPRKASNLVPEPTNRVVAP